MIVSASYRTDIPAFWGSWFHARLADGYCDVPNPYGARPYRVDLNPDAVDGFVFWTRNARPFADALKEVAARGYPFMFQYTLTGYPPALDPFTPRPGAAASSIMELAGRFGPGTVVWRYDPVVITSFTPPHWHVENFGNLCSLLNGFVDECVISFMHVYRKTRLRLDGAGLVWRDPGDEEKRSICGDLDRVARDNGIRLTVCSQPEFIVDAAGEARCVDALRLSRIAGREIRARTRGNRKGCLCSESRDIGEYDSCAHGCVYCYAVSDHGRASRRIQQSVGKSGGD